MNQILVTNDEKGFKNNSIKPIVRFFAVVAIVFALVMIGGGSFNLYKSLGTNKDYARPELRLEKNGSSMNVKVDGEIGINQVIYAWGKGNETIVNANGRKNFNFDIEIPQGENTLKTKIIDVEGNKTKFEDVAVTFSESDDSTKPVISIEKVDGKLSITAIDETELDYFSYKWEDSDEVKITPSESDKKVIKQVLDVQKGTKQLTLVAVDKAGNKAFSNKKVIGSNGPTIKASIADNNFVVKVTAESAITEIQYTLNDETSKINNIPKDAKEFEFKVPLKEGANYLKINAYENGIMSEYKCKKTK